MLLKKWQNWGKFYKTSGSETKYTILQRPVHRSALSALIIKLATMMERALSARVMREISRLEIT